MGSIGLGMEEGDVPSVLLPLAPATKAEVVTADRVSGKGVWALTVFMGLGMTQCSAWATFSQVPDASEEYYGVDRATIDLLLNWGAIVYLPVIPLSSALLTRPDGLRRTTIAAATLTATGLAVRTAPSFFAQPRASWAQPCLHLGQILNAATGCLLMGAPSRLSREWFPPAYWGTSTSLAYMSMGMGAAASTYSASAIVTSTHRLPNLLYLELGMAVVVLLLALAAFPRQRPPPPGREAPPKQGPPFIPALLGCLRRPSLVAVCLVSGLLCGLVNAWRSSLATALNTRVANAKVDVMYASSMVAGLCGGLAAGVSTDRLFARRLKAAITGSVAVCAALYALFTYAFLRGPSSHFGVMTVTCVAAGAIHGFVSPLFYELTAELAFPTDESTPAALMTIINNAVIVVVLFAAPVLPDAALSVCVAATTALCVLIMCPVREQYLRRDALGVKA